MFCRIIIIFIFAFGSQGASCNLWATVSIPENFSSTHINQVLEKIRQNPHPRTFPRDVLRTQLKNAVLEDRTAAWKQLLHKVNRAMKEEITVEPETNSTSLSTYSMKALTKSKIRTITRRETSRMLEAAFAYMINGNHGYLLDCKRFALNLASWDCLEATSFESQDKAHRSITFCLAVVFDWLYDTLNNEEKEQISLAVRNRMKVLYDYYVRSGRLKKWPYDSHGWVHLGHMAVIAAIMVDEIPEAEEWAKQTIPLYFNSISPWGGDDGGFGNGSSYGVWNYTTSCMAWDMLQYSTGLNAYQIPWVRNFFKFMIYFVPPGTPVGAFGDGAELQLHSAWSKFSAGYARRMPSNLSRWYAKHQQTKIDCTSLSVLAAQPMENESNSFGDSNHNLPTEGLFSSILERLYDQPMRSGTNSFADIPLNIPNAAFFPSIGWTAMHSDLSDKNRISVYFKSSPYGSYNHSHADQNSFVINAKGKVLAADSGYYDYYASPHWKKWYQQTLAHNAITYDGGIGQKFGDIKASGKITHFENNNSYGVVCGDATQAYIDGEGIIKARRTLLYLRPGIIIVYDNLSADYVHLWEWNLHSLNKMDKIADDIVMVKNRDTKLCVNMLVPNAVSFNQFNQFTASPDHPGCSFPNQWHGRFTNQEKMKNEEFLAVLTVDAAENIPTVSARKKLDGWELVLADKLITINENGGKVKAR